MTAPAAPTVTAVPNRRILGLIDITIHGVATATVYRLYRGTANAPTVQRGSDLTADPVGGDYVVEDDAVTPGTIYFYRAKAVNAGAEVSAYGPDDAQRAPSPGTDHSGDTRVPTGVRSGLGYMG